MSEIDIDNAAVPAAPGNEFTQLLQEWRGGDESALDRLMPMVYDELRGLASNYMNRERREHTLQATALVHEVYMKLSGTHQTRWNDRAHFLAIASQLMRRVLVDHARAQSALKRGGGERQLSLEDVDAPDPSNGLDILDLHDALSALAEQDEHKARVVELRYFGGLTLAEVAEVTGESIKRVWQESQLAKAWLLREIARSAD